jgi:hypothetical protein
MVTLLVFLEELSEELSNLVFRGIERLPALRRRAIHPAESLTDLLVGPSQVPTFLETVEDRVQRTRAELVTVPPELFDDSQAEDRFMDRVVKNMEADQA